MRIKYDNDYRKIEFNYRNQLYFIYFISTATVFDIKIRILYTTDDTTTSNAHLR